MTGFLIIVSFAAIILVLIYEFYHKSLSIVLWVSLVIFFGFSHITQLFDMQTSAETLNRVSIFVLLFCAIYLGGRMVMHKSSLDFQQKEIEGISSTVYARFASWLYFIFVSGTLLYCILAIVYAGGISNLTKTAIYGFRRRNFLIIILSYILQATVQVSLYYLFTGNKKRFIVCAVCIIVRGLVSFTRTYLIELFIALVLYYIYKKRKVKVKTIVLGIVIGGIAIYAMYLLRGFRYYYGFSDIGSISFSDLNAHAAGFIKDRNGDLFLGSFFYSIVEYGKRIEGIIPGATYFRLLLLPIPSELSFGVKPEDICVSLGVFFGGAASSNLVSYTVTPTLFGDLYANFMFFGVFGGLLWAAIISFFDRIVEKRTKIFKIFTMMLIASAYINIARGSVYNACANIFYGIIIQWLVYKVSRSVHIKIKLH